MQIMTLWQQNQKKNSYRKNCKKWKSCFISSELLLHVFTNHGKTVWKTTKPRLAANQERLVSTKSSLTPPDPGLEKVPAWEEHLIIRVVEANAGVCIALIIGTTRRHRVVVVLFLFRKTDVNFMLGLWWSLGVCVFCRWVSYKLSGRSGIFLWWCIKNTLDGVQNSLAKCRVELF